MIFVCDIDGTVADNTHRLPYIEQQNPKDWDSFYKPELVLLDAPILGAKKVVQDLCYMLGNHFVFLTGRPDRCWEVTKNWLRQNLQLDVGPLHVHNHWHRPFLVTRGDTDRRTSDVYKESQIKKLRKSYGDLEFFLFVDDDLRNTEMYRRHGIFLKAPECWSVFR